MSFVRTVLGDIEPEALGVTYAHEHLVIDGGRPVELFPDFLLADTDRMATELSEAAAAGLRSAIDAMPIACGRNPAKLAELSRRSGVQIVAATGLHHGRFYDPSGWIEQATAEELAALFIADVQEGIDAGDHRGVSVNRSSVRAGVIKVAGSEGGPSSRDSRAFAAAAEAHLRTGAPILTHCENGTGALEQVELLTDLGVRARHITLSHVDRVVDRDYHRDIVSTGAFVEYDQAFRWGDAANGTVRLLRWMVEDHRADHVVVGNDAARQHYYRVYGGRPGLVWLLDIVGYMGTPAVPGLEQQLFVDNPARAFSFAEVAG